MFRPEPDQVPDEESPEVTESRPVQLLGLLTDCERFLRTASPTVHNELREFLTAQGYHPIAGLSAFLDRLQFTVHQDIS